MYNMEHLQVQYNTTIIHYKYSKYSTNIEKYSPVQYNMYITIQYRTIQVQYNTV